MAVLHDRSLQKQTNVQVLLTELKRCSITQNLERGKKLHTEAIECGHDSDIYVASAFINMYAKCGTMVDARKVFDSMKHPNVVAWTALILGYADNGQEPTALDVFTRMKSVGPAPDSVTLVVSLKACTSLALKGAAGRAECGVRGTELHDFAVENGWDSNMYVQNTLINMYAKCKDMENAHKVFDSMRNPNIVSWNALILGYADNGQGLTALNLFARMKNGGPTVNSVTLVAALQACTLKEKTNAWTECRDWIKTIHDLAVENGCHSDISVQNTLISMYSKCGDLQDAHQVFDTTGSPTVVSWTALIMGYADNGEGRTALDLFRKMRTEGPAPNSVTLVASIKASTSLALKGGSIETECMDRGKQIHNLAVDMGCNSSIYVQNTLIDMYAKGRSMFEAHQVFDGIKNRTVVSWTVLILGYAENGQGLVALELFKRMRSEGPAPDSVTILACLKACTSMALENVSRRTEYRDWGKEIHGLAKKNGSDSDIYVQSTLIDMYAKCGSMADAHEVFNRIKRPHVVSWNALIQGYVDNGQGFAALDLFMRMKIEGPAPDSLTFAAALKACSSLGALECGRTIHSEIRSLDVVLVNCLVDMYARCGSLVEAQSLFDMYAEKRNIITWTALLAGFSNCGDHKSVFKLFQAMQDAGFKPDSVTFVSVLTCCSHAGLLEEGKECFDAIPTKYDIVPILEHYSCMIDIFGRTNRLEDAMTLLNRMACSPDDITWMTILSACRKWKNLGIGRLAFQSLIKIDAAGYVLMGQIYGSRGMLQEQQMVMEIRATVESHISQKY